MAESTANLDGLLKDSYPKAKGFRKALPSRKLKLDACSPDAPTVCGREAAKKLKRGK